MLKYDRLVFVCTGNTSRSPMAAAIFERLDPNHEIEIMSRGLVVLFPEPANPKACVVMKNNELSLDNHMSELLKQEEITENTLLLTMSEKQKNTVLETYGDDVHVYTIKEFVGMDGDVVDPYGGSLIDYEQCFSELSNLVKKTIYRLNEEDVK